MPKLTCAGLTDRGRLRKRNEDNLYTNPDQGMFIVSDGMGGHAAGDVASGIVVKRLPELLLLKPKDLEDLSASKAVKHILTALNLLNHYVLEEGRKEASRTGMGATVVLLLIRRTKALVVHMGDSRAYLLRQKHLIQLTKDHSIIQEMIDAGKLTREEAAFHPARSQITNCIGMPHFSRPGTQLLSLAPGDRFLLCSDGLTGMVPDQNIASLLLEHSDPKAACGALVHAANTAGGVDNIAVVVADWHGES